MALSISGARRIRVWARLCSTAAGVVSLHCDAGGAVGGLGHIDCDCCDGCAARVEVWAGAAEGGAGHIDDAPVACGGGAVCCGAGSGVGHIDCTVLSCCGAAGFSGGPTLIRVGGAADGWWRGAGARATTGLRLGRSLGFSAARVGGTAEASALSACSGGG